MSTNCENPIFIVCSASSGSTLLSYLLDKHPDIAIGPELFLFNKPDFYNFNSLFRNVDKWMRHGLIDDGQIGQSAFYFNRAAYGIDMIQFIQLVRSSRNLREFIDLFFEHYLQSRGKRIWGEKTGSNAYCMEYILKLYPRAIIIHIVRDGRDAVASITKRSHSFYHAISHWLYNNAAAVRFKSYQGYYLLRYEDLVSNPENSLRILCKVLNIHYSKDMLVGETNYYWDAHADNNVHDSWNQEPSASITTKSIGSYKQYLSEKQLALFWKLRLTRSGERKLGLPSSTFELMSSFGYDTRSSSLYRETQLRDTGLSFDILKSYFNRLRKEVVFGKRFWFPVTTFM